MHVTVSHKISRLVPDPPCQETPNTIGDDWVSVQALASTFNRNEMLVVGAGVDLAAISDSAERSSWTACRGSQCID